MQHNPIDVRVVHRQQHRLDELYNRFDNIVRSCEIVSAPLPTLCRIPINAIEVVPSPDRVDVNLVIERGIMLLPEVEVLN